MRVSRRKDSILGRTGSCVNGRAGRAVFCVPVGGVYRKGEAAGEVVVGSDLGYFFSISIVTNIDQCGERSDSQVSARQKNG